ncbi:MAG TPA: type IV secretion system protein VirB3 [Sphingomonas sp.]|nr:type IV secretion system protein VirB3 [Sphingomonas sp.]
MEGGGSDPIFAALTRPQMVAGVTYGYAVFELIAAMELFLLTRSFWVLPAVALVHGVGYVCCLAEPRFFDLWVTRARHCPRVRNHRFWRANAYRP